MNDFDRDAQELVEALARMRPIQIELPPGMAFALIGALQLVCRHPGFTGPTRRDVEKFARALQQVMAAEEPLVDRLAERGWHPVFDHRPDPEITPGGTL